MVESSYTVGMKKGMEKGRKEGKEEGRKEGKEEGKKERDIEIARNLLSADVLDIQMVAQMTGLTLKEVEKIKFSL